MKAKLQTDGHLTDGFKSSGTSPPLDLAKTSGTSPPELSATGKLSIPQRFAVLQIENKVAQEIVIKNHYLHRTAPCSWAFGLFDKQNNCTLVGVITYGVGPSSTLLAGVCGPDEAKNVCELTRLWLADNLPKNCESYLIGNSIRLVPREIIVSFADSSAGHIGYVYQATNWIYTGLSTKIKDPRLKSNPHLHQASFAKGLTKKEIVDKYGDDVEYVERSRKHRYVFFNVRNKRRRQELEAKLRYKILPYPKVSAEKSSPSKKICTVCDEEKPDDEFYKKRNSHESCCKNCKKLGNKQKRAAKSKAEKPIWEAALKIVVNSEKKGDLINVLFDLLKTHQPVVEPVAHDDFSVSELLKNTNTIDALLEVEKKKCAK